MSESPQCLDLGGPEARNEDMRLVQTNSANTQTARSLLPPSVCMILGSHPSHPKG